MDESTLAFLTIEQVAPLLRKRKISPRELAEALLRRIERLNPQLNAYLSVTAELALKEAGRAEQEIVRGRWRGPLHGVPVSLKDNIWMRGALTTAGSKLLADFVPAEDATVVTRLRRAGAILVGKTNLHEFAYGVTTNNPHYGPTRNPWSPARIPGGSSGGSAAAVAAGLCFGSVGSDTGGSIRIPAALCGIVGLKPTFGRVSCHGVVPLAKSFDVAGPLARSVADAAILLRAIAGRDQLDNTTWGTPVPDYCRTLRPPRGRKPLARVRLGRPREYVWEHVDEQVRHAVEAAAHDLERLGAVIEEVSLPHLPEAEDPSTKIALAEATAFHQTSGWFPARAAEYSEESRKRLEQGLEIRACEYLQALEFRRVLLADFAAALARVDALLLPTVPVTAPKIGEDHVTLSGSKQPVRSTLLRLNRPANFTGLPAISVPCGFTREELPIGMQFIGRALDEAGLLRIAFLFEQTHEWHRRHPRFP